MAVKGPGQGMSVSASLRAERDGRAGQQRVLRAFRDVGEETIWGTLVTGMAAKVLQQPGE